MEYKQYHETDKKIFHSEEQIYFSQANMHGFWSLHELLRVTSDIAVEDYRQQGMSREFLKEKGFGILVSRLSFRFHKMPVENQKLEIVTWEEKAETLQLVRKYNIFDENKNLLISAKAYWMVVDIKARRLLPTAKFTLRPPIEFTTETDCLNPGKISSVENMELWDKRKIKFSDIDTNGHTTNSRYGAFIEDALPEEYRSKVPTDFKINYSKEAMLGNELSVYGKVVDDGKKLVVIGKTEEGNSFEAELFY